MEIDYTNYVVLKLERDEVPEDLEEYRNIGVEGRILVFVPYDDPILEKYKKDAIKFRWAFMFDVLETLIDKDWDVSFENDADREALEGIEEEYNDAVDRLYALKKYVDLVYKENDPDPILHTRLIITPKDSGTDFIFYYGDTVCLENNSCDDILYLFQVIVEMITI